LCAKQLTAGKSHTCGLDKETKLLRCWGRDNFGQGSVPVLLDEFKKTHRFQFSQISAGDHHTCGVIARAVTIQTTSCGTDCEDEILVMPYVEAEAAKLASVYVNNTFDWRGRVVCWGWNDYDQTTPFQLACNNYLKKPVQVLEVREKRIQ
jgi:alpha-tubulin suppressor-like RCC1 family protein